MSINQQHGEETKPGESNRKRLQWVEKLTASKLTDEGFANIKHQQITQSKKKTLFTEKLQVFFKLISPGNSLEIPFTNSHRSISAKSFFSPPEIIEIVLAGFASVNRLLNKSKKSVCVWF